MSSLFLAATATLDGISPPIAVLAGLVSFVSPCVLPLVPAYLAYLGARAGQPVMVAELPADLVQRPGGRKDVWLVQRPELATGLR